MLHTHLRIAMADEKILELKEILLSTQSPDGSIRKAGEARLLALESQVDHTTSHVVISISGI